MFKIVETVENGEKNYTAVPTGWEENSILYWPKHFKDSDLSKLVKNGASQPMDNWSTMACVVKSTANSFLEARKIEKLYASFSNTEDEESFTKQSIIGTKKRIRKNAKISTEEDYNNELEAIMHEITPSAQASFDEQTPLAAALVQTGNVLQGINMNTMEQNEYEVENNHTDSGQNPYVIVPSNEIENEITAMKSEINDLKNGIIEIKQSQEQLKCEINGIHTKLDRVLKYLGDKTEQTHSVNIHLTNDINFPLKTIQEIQTLNESLISTEFKDEMLNRLSTIGGTCKTSDGSKVMYKIFDFIFEPYVLTKYSWTGSSKTTIKKECFLKLGNIVDLIYEVVVLADCRHSRQRNEEFIKDKILKHSEQRFQRKRKFQDAPTMNENNENEPTNEVQ